MTSRAREVTIYEFYGLTLRVKYVWTPGERGGVDCPPQEEEIEITRIHRVIDVPRELPELARHTAMRWLEVEDTAYFEGLPSLMAELEERVWEEQQALGEAAQAEQRMREGDDWYCGELL